MTCRILMTWRVCVHTGERLFLKPGNRDSLGPIIPFKSTAQLIQGPPIRPHLFKHPPHSATLGTTALTHRPCWGDRIRPHQTIAFCLLHLTPEGWVCVLKNYFIPCAQSGLWHRAENNINTVNGRRNPSLTLKSPF